MTAKPDPSDSSKTDCILLQLGINNIRYLDEKLKKES